MEIVLLLLFVSAVLFGCSIGAFVFTMRANDFDHADRLALAPLDDDSPRKVNP